MWGSSGPQDKMRGRRKHLKEDLAFLTHLIPPYFPTCSCCCSIPKMCQTLCNPMEYSAPGSSDLLYLPELVQIHVHWVSDVIQPSHPLSSPSHPALNLSHIRVSSNKFAFCIWWPEYCSFSFSICPSNEYSGLISFRIDWFDLLAVQGTLKSLL